MNLTAKHGDVSGMIQDAQIYFNIGYDMANSRHWPQWNKDSEFRRPKPSIKN